MMTMRLRISSTNHQHRVISFRNEVSQFYQFLSQGREETTMFILAMCYKTVRKRHILIFISKTYSYLNNQIYLFSYRSILKRQYNWHVQNKHCFYFSVLRQVHNAYHIILTRSSLLRAAVMNTIGYKSVQICKKKFFFLKHGVQNSHRFTQECKQCTHYGRKMLAALFLLNTGIVRPRL